MDEFTQAFEGKDIKPDDFDTVEEMITELLSSKMAANDIYTSFNDEQKKNFIDVLFGPAPDRTGGFIEAEFLKAE